MWITHSYIGTVLGSARCLFFLLYEDYIETQAEFSRALDLELERFARNLGDHGTVARPFLGDVEEVSLSVLDKRWTEQEKVELRKTPSLLMIDKDFRDFDPREHRWVLFHLGDRGFRPSLEEQDVVGFRALFTKISDAVKNQSADPFDVALNAKKSHAISGRGEIFHLRPGMFGVSIDVRVAGKRLRQIYKNFRSGSGNV